MESCDALAGLRRFIDILRGTNEERTRVEVMSASIGHILVSIGKFHIGPSVLDEIETSDIFIRF